MKLLILMRRFLGVFFSILFGLFILGIILSFFSGLVYFIYYIECKYDGFWAAGLLIFYIVITLSIYSTWDIYDKEKKRKI